MKNLYQDIRIGDLTYSKKESWFFDNSKFMNIDDIKQFIRKIESSRYQVFKNNHAPLSNYCSPNYFNDSHINFLSNTAPYTYFDLLLKLLI